MTDSSVLESVEVNPVDTEALTSALEEIQEVARASTSAEQTTIADRNAAPSCHRAWLSDH